MESNSNKNNNNNDGGDKHQQLRGSAQNCKSNKLANDEDKPAAAAAAAAAGEGQNCKEETDLDLEVESLSREELIKLVRKQMTTTMEAKKQMETAKKEAENSVKHAEEFSKRYIQLEQKNVEVQAELGKKLGEIEEMHKEMEKNSKEIAQKAKENEALLTQLKESTSQLSLENWYDWLAFVPRHRLGQIVPMIGDRKFASIVQRFLHEYGEITIEDIEIVAPYEEDPTGPHPRVRAWQNDSWLRFEMAEAQMPANIKNFENLELSYFDQSALNFMHKFQQNGLFENVNLEFAANLSPKDIIQPILSHILPLINGILSIRLRNNAQLVHFYDAGNSKEIYEMNMKMMEQTQYLRVSYAKNLHTNMIDLYCRWLYQTARADGKPRELLIGSSDVDSAPILFIDRLKQDFQTATNPATFLIRIILLKASQPLEAICLDNGKTKERFQTEMVEVDPKWNKEWDRLEISRNPLASTKKWTVGEEYAYEDIASGAI